MTHKREEFFLLPPLPTCYNLGPVLKIIILLFCGSLYVKSLKFSLQNILYTLETTSLLSFYI